MSRYSATVDASTVEIQHSTKSEPLFVIINADDFAIDRPETDAACEGMASGRITSATIMANGRALRYALPYIRHFEGCSFGAHLNITSGHPLTGGPDARLLVDRDGQMSRDVFGQMRPKLATQRAVYAEWCEQVEHLFSLGIAVSHLDSHHHVHTTPFLFPVLKAVQRRFGIRRVRITQNIYGSSHPCTPLLRKKKLIYNFALRHVYRTRTTAGFTDLVTFCEAGRRGKLKHPLVELMVHPGARNSAAEDRLLHSDWERDLPFPIVKTHYGRI
jgi:predicted glycoside hydrolase/deacetylase ChbG (UPF0249 family)